jgi:hypothetical protein
MPAQRVHDELRNSNQALNQNILHTGERFGHKTHAV